MTSRFERRLARIEKLQRPTTEAPPDPRVFVIATLVGFHCCDRGADEHPLQAYSTAAKGPAGEAGMQCLLDGFFWPLTASTLKPSQPRTPSNLQRLLDGVPERWRDAEVAWWPASANEMWGPAEGNQGGEMVRHTIQTVRENLPATIVHTSRGKHARAEPVAALYEVP